MSTNRRRTIIAVASGKGGTGKTTLATSLAAVASQSRRVQLADCDVEAPNAHLFLNPDITRTTTASVAIPVVDAEICTACGACGSACRFSAIVSLKTLPLTFPELCHGCGACSWVCRPGAITEGEREVGTIQEGTAGDIAFIGGTMRIGEAQSPPLIREVRRRLASEGMVILDAPPGASCPMVTAVRGADFAILVTEPTPFGLNDLSIAVDTIRTLDIPFGVVVNRAQESRTAAREWCSENGIGILAEIADDRKVAEAYSTGALVAREIPHVRESIEALIAELDRRVAP